MLTNKNYQQSDCQKVELQHVNSPRLENLTCLSIGLGEGIGNYTLSYDEVESKVCKLAERLLMLKLTRIALLSDNSPDWIMVDLACQRAGITLVPIPLFFSLNQRRYACEICRVDAVITDNIGHCVPWFAMGEKVSLDETKLTLLICNAENIAQVNSSIPPGTHKITFTSGSTGKPKGVCLSNSQQIRLGKTLASQLNLSGVKHLCLLPLAVLLENVAGVYATLESLGEIIVPSLETLGLTGSSQLDVAQLLKCVSNNQPESLICLPQILEALVCAAESGWQVPASLRFVAVGGAKVSGALIQRAHALAIPVYEGYGLSECASVVSLNTPAQNKCDRCGMVLPHLKVEIVDNEIVVAGNNFLGYVGIPDSWFPKKIFTGDLGSIDSEGYLHVSGRKKNLLISSFGRNINPEWIESELMLSPLIQQVVVVGDEKPYCSALIYSHNSAVSQRDIQQWITTVNLRLPDYARVKAWLRLADPFSVKDHTATELGRPKRDQILKKYHIDINSLYAHDREDMSSDDMVASELNDSKLSTSKIRTNKKVS